MKRIVLTDLFIGDYGISQRFGARAWYYYPRFGWKGHNGVDFSCPQWTQLLAPISGDVIVSKNDPKGWGEHVYILDKEQGILYLAAHMAQRQVHEGQYISMGQRIGLSGSTGNSTGPHLHAAVYRCNKYGVKTETKNGFGGALNILDRNIIEWYLKNPSKPL